MKKQQFYIYKHPYVYIVLSHSTHIDDAKVHGVYTTHQGALNKARKYIASVKNNNGYIAILKKPIRGKTSKIISQRPCISWEYGATYSELIVEDDD